PNLCVDILCSMGALSSGRNNANTMYKRLFMGRFLIAIVLIGLVFWALRGLWHGPAPAASQDSEPQFEKTVCCARCGVHVSCRIAIEHDGRHYCCPEHLPR